MPGTFVVLKASSINEYYLTLSSISCGGYFIQSFGNKLKIYDSAKRYTSLLDLQDICKNENVVIVKV